MAAAKSIEPLHNSLRGPSIFECTIAPFLAGSEKSLVAPRCTIISYDLRRGLSIFECRGFGQPFPTGSEYRGYDQPPPQGGRDARFNCYPRAQFLLNPAVRFLLNPAALSEELAAVAADFSGPTQWAPLLSAHWLILVYFRLRAVAPA